MHMSAHWTRSTDYTSNPEGFGLDLQTHRHFTGLLELEADEALQVWAKLLVSTPFTLSMSPATRLEITATADAMASRSMAGFGGAAFFPNMNVIYSPWTQLTYHVHTVVHSSLMSFTTCSI